jgi:cytochrome c oxidase subunit 5b
MPSGAQPGTVPTDIDQATGLERLEILGKMQGIDIFDMKPLDASRTGTSSFALSVTSSMLVALAALLTRTLLLG